MKLQIWTFVAIAFLAACSSGKTEHQPSSLPPIENATAGLPVEKGPVYISFFVLMVTDQRTMAVGLYVTGELPTPCNQLQAEVAQPDAQKNIRVTVYSVAPKDVICTQVVRPFKATIPIDIRNKFDGTYAVYVNEEPAGQIVVQGGYIFAVSQ